MSSITSLRALLQDQKRKEVELLKELIAHKNETIENPKIEMKIHNSITTDLQKKVEDGLQNENELKTKIKTTTKELNQSQQNLSWYQSQLQTCYGQYTELDQYRYNLETRIQYMSSEFTSLQSKFESCNTTISTQAATIDKQVLALRQAEAREKEQQEITKVLRDQVDNIRMEAERTIKECTDRFDLLEKRIATGDVIVEEHTISLQEQSQLLDESRDANHLLNRELKQTQTLLQEVQEKLSSLKTTHSQLEDTVQTTRRQLGASYGYLEQWKYAGNQYEQQIVIMRNQADESMFQYAGRITELEAIIEKINSEVSTSSAASKAADESNRFLRAHLETEKARAEKALADLHTSQDQITEYKQNLHDTQQLNESLRVDLDGINRKISDLQSETNQLKSTHESTLIAMTDREYELTACREAVAMKASELVAAKTDIECALTPQIQALSQSVESLTMEKEQIQTSLQQYIHDYECMCNEKSSLEQKLADQVKLVTLSDADTQRHIGEVQSLSAKVYELSSTVDSLNLEKQGLLAQVTQQAEIQQQGANLYTAEIENLKQQLHTMNSRVYASDEETKQLHSQLSAVEQELESRCNEFEASKSALSMQVDKANQDRDHAFQSLSLSTEQNTKLLAQLDALDETNPQTQQGDQRVTELTIQLQQMTFNYSNAQQDASLLRQQAEEKDITLDKLQTNMRYLMNEFSSLQSALASRESESAPTTSTILSDAATFNQTGSQMSPRHDQAKIQSLYTSDFLPTIPEETSHHTLSAGSLLSLGSIAPSLGMADSSQCSNSQWGGSQWSSNIGSPSLTPQAVDSLAVPSF